MNKNLRGWSASGCVLSVGCGLILLAGCGEPSSPDGSTTLEASVSDDAAARPDDGGVATADGSTALRLDSSVPPVGDGGTPEDVCEVGEAITASCLCAGATQDAGWCCAAGHSDVSCSTGCSAYERAVSVPPYDASNPEHALIRSDGDWSQVNAPDKRFFYVAPGDYADVRITRDGSASARRFIALYNDNDTHPALLPDAEQASVSLIFEGVTHWTVDRISLLDRPDGMAVDIGPSSKHIVLNRLHVRNFRRAVQVTGNPSDTDHTEDIVLQNSRIAPMSFEGIDGDSVAIMLRPRRSTEAVTLTDVHILNNEIHNSNDGVMLISFWRNGGGEITNYAGTIVDCNDISIDQDVYTDGSGRRTPDGTSALTENAVDLKGGSLDPSRPVVISNNHFWGYRPTDTNGGGSGSNGSALGLHNYVANLEVHHNVIFDSPRAISFGTAHGLSTGCINVNAHDNIFYGIHNFGSNFVDVNNINIERNTYVDFRGGGNWLNVRDSNRDLDVACNVLINVDPLIGTRSRTTRVSENFFYDTTRTAAGDGMIMGTAADAQMADLVFTTDRYTARPREITLPGVVTTERSPHREWCGAAAP